MGLKRFGAMGYKELGRERHGKWSGRVKAEGVDWKKRDSVGPSGLFARDTLNLTREEVRGASQ